MQKIKLYIQDSIQELTQKVSWPTWSELQSSAILVMVASMIIALIIFLMDSGFQAMMNLIYGMFN